MKTETEEAKRLVKLFLPLCDNKTELRGKISESGKQRNAKQCALIAVDENYRGKLEALKNVEEFLPSDIFLQAKFSEKKKAQRVKEAINKL